jgi:hypothetical protein
LRLPAAGRIATAAALLLLGGACRTAPVPPEYQEALRLDEALGGAGASSFAPQAYARFREELAGLREEVRRQEARLGPWRNFGSAATAASDLKREGGRLLEEIRASREDRRRSLARDLDGLSRRRDRLADMTGYFNDNEVVRQALARADITLGRTRLLLAEGKADPVSALLEEASGFLDEAQTVIARRLERYLDPEVLRRWRAWADETIADSRRSGGTAFLVSKIERTLTVIRRGEIAATYGIGLGKSGLDDKLFEGDEATPEGRYRIVRKFPVSAFHKALLIDYPSPADLKDLAEAKRRGLAPAGKAAGGAIEIHGGGKDKLTLGCVGLENKDMDEVYKAAAVGTPVTIVGALGVEGTILGDIRAFGR